ncbi:MAG: hypothetical protein JWP85_2087 [Rhodoglobus sp.]|nr:hypothetical protein [Rhodoglobus sp.]
MKAITVRNPWAAAMFLDEAPKTIENRTWKTAYRGPLAIVAGTQPDTTPEADLAWRLVSPRPALRVGAIVGVVELLNIHQQFTAECDCVLESHGGWARCTRLSAPRPMQHWVLGSPRLLASHQVFPYRGFLGIGELGAGISEALLKAIA